MADRERDQVPQPLKTRSVSVKSAERVFKVLELMDREERALTVKEIALILGFPSSSTSALLGGMVKAGYLEIEKPGRRFRPTLKTARLGSWIANRFEVDDRTSLMMQYVSRMTEETVLLAVLDQWTVLYTHVIQSTLPLRLHVPIGTKRPLHMSGTGQVLLADLDDNTITKNFRNMAGLWDIGGDITVEDLLKRVHESRTNGFAVNVDTITPGAGIVAVPIPYKVCGTRAAIAVGGSSSVVREKWEERVNLLRSTITRFSDTPIGLE